MVGVSFKNFLVPIYVDNQLLFWKYTNIILFLIWQLGPLLHFLALWGYFLGRDQVQKQFSERTYVVNQLLFWKNRPIFLF